MNGCVYGWCIRGFTELVHQACNVDCRQAVLSLLDKNCEARFLDCGCGNGDGTLKGC